MSLKEIIEVVPFHEGVALIKDEEVLDEKGSPLSRGGGPGLVAVPEKFWA